MNDFLATVKPTFAFLTQQADYELLHEEVADSFDNGMLIYQSAALRIAVIRDRGEVRCDARARGDYRDIDDEILRLLVDGARHYPRAASAADFRAATVAGFLRERLADIEQLFAPQALAATHVMADQLRHERGETLFGRKRKA